MRLCLPAMMGGGGKAESLPWRGPAGEARHTGRLFCFGKREGKALGVPAYQTNRAVRLPIRNAAHAKAHLHGATQTGGVAASEAGTRLLSRRDSAASHRERAPVARPARTEARVPAGQPEDSAPSRSAQRGKECDLRKSRSSSSRAPDRHPDGPRPKAWCAQRIEQVAVRQH